MQHQLSLRSILRASRRVLTLDSAWAVCRPPVGSHRPLALSPSFLGLLICLLTQCPHYFLNSFTVRFGQVLKRAAGGEVQEGVEIAHYGWSLGDWVRRSPGEVTLAMVVGLLPVVMLAAPCVR